MGAQRGARRLWTTPGVWVVLFLLFAAVVEGANERNFDIVVQSADIKQVNYDHTPPSPATKWYDYQKKKLRRYAEHVVWHAPEYVLAILVIWFLRRRVRY